MCPFAPILGTPLQDSKTGRGKFSICVTVLCHREQRTKAAVLGVGRVCLSWPGATEFRSSSLRHASDALPVMYWTSPATDGRAKRDHVSGPINSFWHARAVPENML